MKRILILLCLPLLFTTCKKEEDSNNPSNSTTGTISDVVGIWHFLGRYDALGNLEYIPGSCELKGTITLDALGDGVWTEHYLSNNGTGPCLSQSQVFSFNYINSTTLQFIVPSSCGNPTVTLPTSTQFQIPSCNGSNGTWSGGYSLFEL